MRILDNSKRVSRRAPSKWFTGEVWLDPIVNPEAPSRLGAAYVTFAPGARTNWHTHPVSQILHVVSGAGWVQLEGEAAQRIAAGDVVVIGAGENHWHGAEAGRTMVHLAMHEADERGETADWGRAVTEEEYAAAG